MNPLTNTLKARLPTVSQLDGWIEQFIDDMPGLKNQRDAVVRRAKQLARRWRRQRDDFWSLAHVYADAVDCAVSLATHRRRTRRARKRYRVLLISELCWKRDCPVNLFRTEDASVLCDALEELGHPLLDVLRKELTIG